MPVYVQSESPRTLQNPIQETITPHRHRNSHQQQVSEPMAMEYSNSPRTRNDLKKLTIFISDKLSVKFFFIFKKTTADAAASPACTIRSTSANSTPNGPIESAGQLRNGSSDRGDRNCPHRPN